MALNWHVQTVPVITLCTFCSYVDNIFYQVICVLFVLVLFFKLESLFCFGFFYLISVWIFRLLLLSLPLSSELKVIIVWHLFIYFLLPFVWIFFLFKKAACTQSSTANKRCPVVRAGAITWSLEFSCTICRSKEGSVHKYLGFFLLKFTHFASRLCPSGAQPFYLCVMLIRTYIHSERQLIGSYFVVHNLY